MEAIAYAFFDIPSLDCHRPCFLIKNMFKLLKEKVLEMISKYGRTEGKVGLRAVARIIIFEAFQLIIAL